MPDTPATATVTVTAVQSTPKGWQTSEFWATTAVSLVTILNNAFGWHIPTETILTIAGLVASYILSRTVVKATA